jgi:hypothetical protein
MEGKTSPGWYSEDVKAVRAHVRDGRIVLDEPVELPEGAVVEVLVPDAGEIDREALEAELDASAAEFERGEYEDARVFVARLAAKS